MDRAAETRHRAVRVTASGEELHFAKLDGETERLTLDVLALAMRVMPVVLGLQVNESGLGRLVVVMAGNVIVTGLTAHVAWGEEVAAKPTSA